MRIVNPNGGETSPHFYVGTCKGNQAPKHVTAEGVETRKVKLDKKPVTMFNSSKSAEYIYIKQGENWLYVKDKSIFNLDSLESAPVTRSAEGQATANVEA